MRVVECDQYSPEWWAVRKSVPTASEFGNIITPKKCEYSKSAFKYACKLIAEKYDAYYGMPSEFATAAMKNGTIMEPESRQFYVFETGEQVKQVGFCLTDDGRFGCSPDALVGDSGVLELKNPQPATHVEWLINDTIPDDYMPQVHGHLIVTGREFCDFMSYSPGLPKLLIRVEPGEYTKRLAEHLETFWTQYQTMLRKIEGDRQEAIDAAIDAAGGPEESYF